MFPVRLYPKRWCWGTFVLYRLLIYSIMSQTFPFWVSCFLPSTKIDGGKSFQHFELRNFQYADYTPLYYSLLSSGNNQYPRALPLRCKTSWISTPVAVFYIPAALSFYLFDFNLLSLIQPMSIKINTVHLEEPYIKSNLGTLNSAAQALTWLSVS